MTTQPSPEQAPLHDHAARLLLGTGVDPSQAALVASGAVPHPSPAAAALRDGWRSAERQATP